MACIKIIPCPYEMNACFEYYTHKQIHPETGLQVNTRQPIITILGLITHGNLLKSSYIVKVPKSPSLTFLILNELK